MKEKTCCFSGHRILPADETGEIRNRIINAVRELVQRYDVRYFGVGGAIGFDMLAAETLFELRDGEFPHIKVILVYPFPGYNENWSTAQKNRLRMLLPKFDKTVCVSQHGSREAYLARNRHLVDNAKFCIVYCNKKSGGTAYTLWYAKAKGAAVYNPAQ
ncbi:MAG: DUF1273 family protein [Clostridia bacterium]|nr:DUF1273 family protein [Clostridia bacterium]